jgi:hypothetical protein
MINFALELGLGRIDYEVTEQHATVMQIYSGERTWNVNQRSPKASSTLEKALVQAVTTTALAELWQVWQ